jgi:hypothetical protein
MSNRKVSTDALETLGTIIGEGEKRDAIHLAVIPVVAESALMPGSDIDCIDGKAHGRRVGEGLGIVDPFLTRVVERGERCWMVLKPRMVTSLRHVWSHPAFPDEPGAVLPAEAPMSAAEANLRVFADQAGLALAALLDGAREYRDGDEYMIQGGRWEGFSIPDDFWSWFEEYTGEKAAQDRGNFFSCSC